MGHGHLHPGESARDYFTEQLLTILVCALFGFAAIQMYRTGMLGFLTEQFRTPVLYGGIGVLVLVVLRSIAVWKEAGELQAQAVEMGCGIDHVHSVDCNHEPGIPGGEGEADHTHTSDMSWVFARMMILVFPVGLFFLGLPNASFSKERQLKLAGTDTALDAKSLKELATAEGTQVYEEKTQPDGTRVRMLKTAKGLTVREMLPPSKERQLALAQPEQEIKFESLPVLAKDAAVLSDTKQPDGSIVRTLKSKSGVLMKETSWPPAEPTYALVTGDGVHMKFNELNELAYDEAKRQSHEGSTVIVEGRLKRVGDKEFTLFRLKMTCCAADTVPLKVRIVLPQALSGHDDFEWVQVKGQLQFYKIPGQGKGPAQYVPVLMVGDITDVKGPKDGIKEKSEYES